MTNSDAERTNVLARYAGPFAAVALASIVREYPNKPDHLLNHPEDVLSPRALHPAFYGCYDWHSSVHMHWSLARLLCNFPDSAQSSDICKRFNNHFSPANIDTEIDYLLQPGRATFERTYGWAWLLKLQSELIKLAENRPELPKWHRTIQPLADLIVDSYLNFLPLAEYPIRSGTHANSAFGVLFPYDYGKQVGHSLLTRMIEEKARRWFATDQLYPAGYEPGGHDFLSPGLVEAVLMLRVLGRDEFKNWWNAFCPIAHDLDNWLSPVEVRDRKDPQMAHLDGLNLSRAWCWAILEPHLPNAIRGKVEATVTRHLTASLPHVTEGEYVGTHWLTSFALLALTHG